MELVTPNKLGSATFIETLLLHPLTDFLLGLNLVLKQNSRTLC